MVSNNATSFVMYMQSFYNVLVFGEDELQRINLLAGIMIGVSPIIHLIIVSGIDVPYGRFASSAWGFPINAKVAWFLQEVPALVLPMYFYITCNSPVSLPASILIGLFMVHYTSRSCIYPLKIKGGKPTPFLIFLSACLFCIWNGYMQAVYLLYFSNYRSEYILEWNFVVGLLIFCFGFYTNNQSDEILRNLRKDGSTGYKIPYGGMFDYVCAANLWGETVEWIGWALACWSLQSLAFALFALCLLSAKSYSHHKWYLKKFDDYPKDRKIFIPYLL